MKVCRTKSKISVILLAFLLSSPGMAGEDQTIGNNNVKFKVSKQEALKAYKTLINDTDVTRPPVNKIPIVNGGKQVEEDETLSQSPSCWADETQHQQIKLSVLNPWMRAFKKRDANSFNKLLSKKFKRKNFLGSLQFPTKKMDYINMYQWENNTKKESAKKYLSSFSKIVDMDLVTFKYLSPRKHRDKDLNMVKAELQIRYDLRGFDKKGNRRNDRGPLFVTVVKEGQNWKIDDINTLNIESLVSTKSAFSEISKLTGVTKIPEYQRVEAIRRGGYAIGMEDYDNDGIIDMYVGAYGPGKLLKGKKDGTFSEAKNSGIEQDTYVKTSVFADFNNDGNKDLLLVRFVPSEAYQETAKLYRNDIIMYKNLGKGKFKKVPGLISKDDPTDYAMPAAVADFDNDGKLDFYVGFPGAKDFTTFGKPIKRKGYKQQAVYFNKGDFKFASADNGAFDRNKFDKYTNLQKLFPHSSVALDFDQDGDMDIVVIDDRGNISPAYQNDGKGNFTQAQKHLGIEYQGFGMGLAAADIDNNGTLDMVMTSANFTSKMRFDQSCKSNWDDHIFNVKDHGIRLFKGFSKGRYTDATMENGLFYAGEGLAGAEFFDYNNDGFQDLYVANGLWTGTNKEQDLSDTFIRSFLANDERILMTVQTETQSTIMKILNGFQGDLYEQGKGIEERPHMAGFQRNRLFRNNGDGTFVEVGFLENVDSLADGYIISKSDIDKDGDLDLVLRNGDPGSKDVNYPAVQVYKNNFGGKSLRIKLLAETSNKDAIGSSVAIKTKSGSQMQQLIGNNGTAQSESILHFGLGSDKIVDKVIVTWPNGKIQIMKNVKPGFHVIREENQGFTSK